MLTLWWPDYRHDISYSILSSTESMASTIPRTGLKRTGLTLLLIIIYIFVGIKIIVACSAHICKWATKIVSKEIYRPMLTSSTLRIQCSMSAWRSCRRWTFAPNPTEMEWCLMVGPESSSFAPFLFAHFCSPLILKEPNYGNEITRQFNLPPDLCSPECTLCLA